MPDKETSSRIDYIDLPWLIAESAVDIDNYRQGRSKDLASVSKLLSQFKKYQDSKSELGIDMAHFHDFYSPFGHAVSKTSDKKITQPSELAVKFKLFTSELEDVLSAPVNPERLEEITLFLCEFSKQLSCAREFRGYRRGLVA